MGRKRGSRDGGPALIVQMFDDGDSPDDIAAELDLSGHYVRGVIRKAGRKLPRTYKMRMRQTKEAHSPCGYSIIYDPFGLFIPGAFFTSEEVKAAKLIGSLVPGMTMLCREDNLQYIVRGELDARQELVRA